MGIFRGFLVGLPEATTGHIAFPETSASRPRPDRGPEAALGARHVLELFSSDDELRRKAWRPWCHGWW